MTKHFRHERLNLALLLSTIIALFSLLVREVHDPDTWWQVAIGKDILANLTIPRSDHFTAAAFGRPYHDSHWLFQVILAVADRLGAMKGVGMVMVVTWSATIGSCYMAIRRWLTPAASCLLISVVILACSERFNSRPEIVTYLMVSLFVLRFQENKYRSLGDVTFLAFLQVVWSNSHGLFVIGPFIAGCYLVAAAIRKLRLNDSTEFLAAIKITVILILASLVTPFGVDGWRYALLLMQEAGPNGSAVFKQLKELQTPFRYKYMFSPDFWPFLLLLMAAGYTSISILLKRKVFPPRLFMVTVFAILAAGGARSIPLFALTAAPLVAENTGSLFPRFTLSSIIGRLTLALGLLAFSWLPVSGRYYRMLGYDIRFGLGVTQAFYPAALPDFLHKIRFSGQIYNANYLGGYCLYYGFRPLIDSRWEVYDESILARINMAVANPQEWEWLVTTYNIKGILLPNWNTQYEEVYYRINFDPRWRLAYEDAAALFWVRSDM